VRIGGDGDGAFTRDGEEVEGVEEIVSASNAFSLGVSGLTSGPLRKRAYQ